MRDTKEWDLGPVAVNTSPLVNHRCEHRFVHLRTSRRSDCTGGYTTKFTLVDFFFCERCLEEKSVKKEEYSRDTPEWFV